MSQFPTSIVAISACFVSTALFDVKNASAEVAAAVDASHEAHRYDVAQDVAHDHADGHDELTRTAPPRPAHLGRNPRRRRSRPVRPANPRHDPLHLDRPGRTRQTHARQVRVRPTCQPHPPRPPSSCSTPPTASPTKPPSTSPRTPSRFEKLPAGTQPAITGDELAECEDAARNSPEFRAALKKARRRGHEPRHDRRLMLATTVTRAPKTPAAASFAPLSGSAARRLTKATPTPSPAW